MHVSVYLTILPVRKILNNQLTKIILLHDTTEQKNQLTTKQESNKSHTFTNHKRNFRMT